MSLPVRNFRVNLLLFRELHLFNPLDPMVPGLQLDLSKDISAGLELAEDEDDPSLADLHSGDSEYWTRQLAG